MKYLLALIVLFATASCYRMPDEDEVSVVPSTNNPSIIRKESNPMMPGAAPNINF